jgi:hypothetical protein
MLAAPYPFQLHGRCFNHLGRGAEQPVGHWTLKIFSNYLQRTSAYIPPPRRHLLLQGKESDGDKFIKVLANAEAIQNKCKFKVAEASE